MDAGSIILPKYVFRGTSYGFAGNQASILRPCTHTTRNPAKAALFAMRCRLSFDAQPVIYIADTAKLNHLPLIDPNVLSHIEEEYNWEIRPIEFCKYCEGYIELEDLKNVLKQINVNIAGSVTLHNLSERCEQVSVMDNGSIDKLYLQIQKFLKTN